MIDLVYSIERKFTPDFAYGLSEVIGESLYKTQKVVRLAIPSVVAGIAEQARLSKNHSTLLTVFQKGDLRLDQFDDVGSLFKSTVQLQHTVQSGRNMISQIFGDDALDIFSTLAVMTGVNPSGVAYILSVVASVSMSVLGRELNSKGLAATPMSEILAHQMPRLQSMLSAKLQKIILKTGKTSLFSAPIHIKGADDRTPHMIVVLALATLALSILWPMSRSKVPEARKATFTAR